MCQNVSKEVGQQYSINIVTFDIAVAMKAYELLWEKSQDFSDVIVRIGVFHFLCAYMHAVGKSVRYSRFDEILVESGISASRSIEKLCLGNNTTGPFVLTSLCWRHLKDCFFVCLNRNIPGQCQKKLKM